MVTSISINIFLHIIIRIMFKYFDLALNVFYNVQEKFTFNKRYKILIYFKIEGFLFILN